MVPNVLWPIKQNVWMGHGHGPSATHPAAAAPLLSCLRPLFCMKMDKGI